MRCTHAPRSGVSQREYARRPVAPASRFPPCPDPATLSGVIEVGLSFCFATCCVRSLRLSRRLRNRGVMKCAWDGLRCARNGASAHAKGMGNRMRMARASRPPPPRPESGGSLAAEMRATFVQHRSQARSSAAVRAAPHGVPGAAFGVPAAHVRSAVAIRLSALGKCGSSRPGCHP